MDLIQFILYFPNKENTGFNINSKILSFSNIFYLKNVCQYSMMIYVNNS